MIAAVKVDQALVLGGCFLLIMLVGLYAGRWRKADLTQLDEWALGGRRFGGFLTWFLQGGSIYTTYSFIAVPALVYGKGAVGFFALPYLVVAYPVAFVLIPRLWDLAREHGYVTAADFVLDRFGNRWLALAVTVTGLVSMLPYTALQVFGIQVAIAQVGVPVEASLWGSFAILALITYLAGLRSATLIAVVKDVFIWITVLVSVIYIPIRLGGYGAIFAHVPHSKIVLPGSAAVNYATLAVGSGLALFLYPHTITGSLSSQSRSVIQRNSIFLPVYTVMLGLLALLGYMAIAAGVQPDPQYGANVAVPALLEQMLPGPVAAFGLASIAIGALVPAAMMAIASGNLFARNVYVQFIEPDATPARQTQVSKTMSMALKLGAVGFVILVPTTYVINFQLAGGIWILQTLPAVFLGLVLRRLDPWAALAGWTAGTALGTAYLIGNGFASSSAAFGLFGHDATMFIGVPALLLNLAVTAAATPAARVLRGRRDPAGAR